jgi:hypothetical protein
LQDLVFEARTLLWSMVDNNMRTLSAFLKCNLENMGTPRDPDPQLWSSILVRACWSPFAARKQQKAILSL